MSPSGRTDYSRAPDDLLVEACRRGEHLAWRELVNRYRRLVYGISRAVGLQPADADEVFQHTFAELVRHLPRLREPSRLEPWLVTTARRASVRLRREERRRRLLADRSAVESATVAPSIDSALDRVREGERLRRALESLGEPCHGLLAGLFADPARPYRELARALGLAVGSLGALRARCLERLRRRLRREPPRGADR
jgi:RNA polymerase sigma factor (sigma-70 family)